MAFVRVLARSAGEWNLPQHLCSEDAVTRPFPSFASLTLVGVDRAFGASRCGHANRCAVRCACSSAGERRCRARQRQGEDHLVAGGGSGRLSNLSRRQRRLDFHARGPHDRHVAHQSGPRKRDDVFVHGCRVHQSRQRSAVVGGERDAAGAAGRRDGDRKRPPRHADLAAGGGSHVVHDRSPCRQRDRVYRTHHGSIDAAVCRSAIDQRRPSSVPRQRRNRRDAK